MRAFLTGQHGNLPVPAGSNILGRGQDCGLRIDDPRLSRHHARLLNDGRSLVIEDLGSTNGVLVNGERIQGKKSLVSGDTVVCGPCVFSVSLDPTLKASASELLPGTDRRPDPRQTEPMDPLSLPGSDWVHRKKTVAPQIADAVSAAAGDTGGATGEGVSAQASSGVLNADAFASDVSSDVLKPNEQLKVDTAPLIHRSDTTPRGNPIPAPAEIAEPRPPRPPKEKTTGWIPADLAPNNTPALQPDFFTTASSGPAPAGRRLIAGVADAVTAVLLALLLGLPLCVGGYVWSLSQAGAVIEDGLPQIGTQPGAATGPTAVVASLFHQHGLARAGELANRMMHAEDQHPFLTLFAASTLGVLVAVVGVLVYLVGETVVRGAPFWHRRCGLEILEHRTGQHVSWGRSTARWLAFAVLWPLAPLTLALDQRGLHDHLSGCSVRKKREP